jgi:hypothetical protein
MTKPKEPDCCPICGYYLTTAIQFNGHRCTDPSHWLAAGQVAPTDYYRLAEVFARDSVELNERLHKSHHSS